MGLKEAFEAILRFGEHSDDPADGPVSIVLILREQRFPTLEPLRQAAEKAFGRSFSIGSDARHCVYQKVLFTLMKVGPHTLSFMFYAKPYGDQTLAAAMSLPSQRKAWSEQTAWVAIDYAKGDADSNTRYAVLAKLCAELYDSNCLGIYLPKEGAFIPEEAPARGKLKRIIESQPIDVA
jgi:hypothetical protein